MPRINLMVGFAVLILAVFSWNTPVRTQGPAQGKKTKPHELEGLWTQAYLETPGNLVCVLPCKALALGMVANGPLVWHFSNNKIKTGPGDGILNELYTYQLDHKNKGGIMALAWEEPLDDGTIRKNKVQANYDLKDDWLIIAWNDPNVLMDDKRPLRWRVILRRGKIKLVPGIAQGGEVEDEKR